MYTFYRRLGQSEPTLIHTTENVKSLKDSIISYLQKDGFTKEQSISLVEFGIPIKWRNGKFMEATVDGPTTILETEDKQLSYLIILNK